MVKQLLNGDFGQTESSQWCHWSEFWVDPPVLQTLWVRAVLWSEGGSVHVQPHSELRLRVCVSVVGRGLSQRQGSGEFLLQTFTFNENWTPEGLREMTYKGVLVMTWTVTRSIDKQNQLHVCSGSWSWSTGSGPTLVSESDLGSVLLQVSKLIVLDPHKRLSVREALQHPWVLGKAARFSHMDTTQRKLQEFNARRKLKVCFLNSQPETLKS